MKGAIELSSQIFLIKNLNIHMQVETSTNIKQSWSIRLHYQTTIISVSFSIFRTPYSSLALLSYSKSEQSCLSSIPIPFFFFFFPQSKNIFCDRLFKQTNLPNLSSSFSDEASSQVFRNYDH